MSETPKPASKSFDTATHISLQLASETIDVIFAAGITDQTADAAFKVIDRVAAADKTDVALDIAGLAWATNPSVRDIAHQKALQHLSEVPEHMLAAKAYIVLKNIPSETDMKEKAFVAVLDALKGLDHPAAIEQSSQFKNHLYQDSLRYEPTSEIISHKTRAVSLVVDLLEKYHDYPFLDNMAGKLVRDIAQVYPEQKEDFLRRLEIISPKNFETNAAKDAQVSYVPEAKAPSTDAQKLAQELLNPRIK